MAASPHHLPASDQHPPGLSLQGSLASLDAEALLTCGLNLLCLGRAEHVLELQPVLESLGHCMRYVTAYGNERGFSHMHHFRGLSSLQLRHRRPEPGVYQLEVVNTAGPWGTRLQGCRLGRGTGLCD